MSKRNIRIVTSDTESYSSAKEDNNKENVAGEKRKQIPQSDQSESERDKKRIHQVEDPNRIFRRQDVKDDRNISAPRKSNRDQKPAAPLSMNERAKIVITLMTDVMKKSSSKVELKRINSEHTNANNNAKMAKSSVATIASSSKEVTTIGSSSREAAMSNQIKNLKRKPGDADDSTKAQVLVTGLGVSTSAARPFSIDQKTKLRIKGLSSKVSGASETRHEELIQKFNECLSNADIPIKSTYNFRPNNYQSDIENEVHEITKLLIAGASKLDDLVAEESRFQIELARINEILESSKSKKEVQWKILKQHIVQKYPFTRLREQDKLSFMEILCVHYDVQSKSQKSVHLQKYQSQKTCLPT
jgi:hypothetical protein